MPYLIDGHNLIGQMSDLSLSDPHDEAKLVEHLKRYMTRQDQRCTVVFDAGLPGGPSRELSNSIVQVVFAHGGTSADAIILERIREIRDPGAWTVVSADRAIIQTAQQRRMRVLSPRAFGAALAAGGVSNEADASPHLTPEEVDEWLRLFGQDPSADPP